MAPRSTGPHRRRKATWVHVMGETSHRAGTASRQGSRNGRQRPRHEPGLETPGDDRTVRALPGSHPREGVAPEQRSGLDDAWMARKGCHGGPWTARRRQEGNASPRGAARSAASGPREGL